MGSRRWRNVTKIIVSAALAIIAIVLLVTFRQMIAPTIVAFLLAFILSYPVNWIQRSTGWARGAATLIVYATLLALTVIASVLIVPRSVELATGLRTSIEQLIVNLQSMSAGALLDIGPWQISLDSIFREAGNVLSSVLMATASPLSLARGVTNSILSIVYVLVLTFWLLKDLYKLQRLALEAVPPDYREDARRLGAELGETWHSFLRGQVTLALVVGVMTWIPLAMVGMANAGGLALLAGLMEFLPSFGPTLSGLVGTVIALFQGSTWMPVNNLTFAVIVLIIYSIIAQIENIYLVPRFVGGQVRLHPAVTFVAIVSGTMVFGLLGVLLATPIVASARTLLIYVYRKLTDQEPFDELAPPKTDVRIPGVIAGRKIEGIIFDLDGTLAFVDWSFVEWAERKLTWLDRVISPATRRRLARRLMLALEGLVHFLIGLARRFRIHPDLDRLFPALSRIRGYPPVNRMLAIPGAGDTLATLSMQYQLVLASTRPRAEISAFLSKSNLPREAISHVLGREDVGYLLPNTEVLLIAAEKLGIAPNQMLLVSDNHINLRAAKAAHIATAGILCGLSEEDDLREADITVASASELLEWL